MPLYAYMDIPGVAGASRNAQKKVEGNVPVTAFTHEVRADLDPATHKPDGKKLTHRLFVITKNVDLSSVELRRKYQQGATLEPVLKLWHQPRSGPEHWYFSIALHKAQIAYMRLVMPSNVHDRERREYEEIGFTYEAIAYQAEAAAGGETMDQGYGPSRADYVCADHDLKFGPTSDSWLEVHARRGLEALQDRARALAAQQSLIELQYAQYKLDNPPPPMI